MDELVTHADVMQWLSDDVQRELTLAMAPEQRGWYTRAEMESSEGCFVEGINMEHAEARYFRTDLRR